MRNDRVHPGAPAEVVLADGSLVRTDADHHPELFWALRGGGGNFGVVTALEIRLLPLAEVYAGLMLWDAARAREVCRAWAGWTHGLADARRAAAALEPWSSGRRFANFAEEAVDPASIFAAGTLARLRTVRAQLNPAGIFAANHVIG